MIKKVCFGLLALTALICLYLTLEQVWLRHWLSGRLGRLEATDRSEFSRAYADLAYDSDPRVSHLLCDALDRRPSRELRYQIVRVLYTRLGLHYVPENTQLPSNEALRRLVKERYAQRALTPQGKP